MRSLLSGATLLLTPCLASAQVPVIPLVPFAPPPSLGPPAPGMPVNFVACPERTAGGSWVAHDPASGYIYSLAGASPPPANRVIRITGVVSPAWPSTPGCSLAPVTIVVGSQPCQSAGVLQHVPGSLGVGPWFGNPPVSVPARAITKD